jgi:hypothetical protein
MDDRSGALDCGFALPLDGALALCRLGGAAFGVKTPGSTTAVRLLGAGIANGVAGIANGVGGIANGVAGIVTVAAADAGEQLAGLMLSHTTTMNEWVPPTKTGVVKVVGPPDTEVALLSKNTVTWPIVRAWPVVYVVGFVQASVTLLVGGLVCAIAGATTSAPTPGFAVTLVVLAPVMTPVVVATPSVAAGDPCCCGLGTCGDARCGDACRGDAC